MKVHGKAALVVVDVLKGEVMAHDAGVPVIDGAAERHARILELVESARAAGVPVVFVQDVHGRTTLDIARELDPRPDEYPVRKPRHSAFFATELDIVLRRMRARTLILVGALTDVCVHLTFADAHRHDYHCRVVDDCVAGSSQAASDAALQAMVHLQCDCRVDSDDVLAAFAAMRAIEAGR